MANVINSPYMTLPVPIVGVDPGPDYATNVNSCLGIIDQHNHTPGSGVLITPEAMDINADLTFQDNNATNIRAARFFVQPSAIPATGADLDELYVTGVDLYFNDGLGNQIRLTQNGAVSGTPGSISNLVAPASVSYNTVNKTFVFQSDVNTPANLDAASITLRNLTANSQGLTLSPPNAMGSSYTITLPALPTTTQPLQITNSGVEFAAPITLAQVNTAFTTFITPLPPTQQIFTSGTGTYTPTVSAKGTPLYIRIRMVGGGGGGNAGNNGGATTFGTALLTANGGQTGGGPGGYGGAGGTVTVNAPAIQIVAVQGGAGSPGFGGGGLSGMYPATAIAGSTAFGGAGGANGGNSSGNGGSGIIIIEEYYQ